MADADDTKKEKQEDIEDVKAEKTDEKAPGGGILPWIIMVVVIAACGGSGFALGRFFAGSHMLKTAEHSQEDAPPRAEYLKADAPDLIGRDSQKVWYYDLEPVVANLDVPGITRYVRAAITLEVSAEVDQEKGGAFLEEKKPVLKNWLTIYLASLTLEDIRGDRNLKHIQSQILDSFNEKLFPDAKPQIKHILFKEFAIQ